MRKIVTAALALSLALSAFAQAAPPKVPATQSPLESKTAKQQAYPKVVLYSTSWCPHCKEAKEYFTAKNIPFINKDVELDDKAMEELTGKYKSQGVPVVVLGNDQKVIKGFSPALFEKAVKEVQTKQ